MEIGNFAVYNGKKYVVIDRKGRTVTITSDDSADVENGFSYHVFFKYYYKDVDIEDLSECYESIEMCDYLGESFVTYGRTDDTVVITASNSSYVEKGFVPDGRDGYIKELKRSEAVIRYVKKDFILFYKIESLLKDRITDDKSINDFSCGVLNRRFNHGMKGCFFYDGTYYVYSKVDGFDVMGPFNEQDIIYACAKILGKEDLFTDYKFSEDAEKMYVNNVCHTTEEMKQKAYLISH